MEMNVETGIKVMGLSRHPFPIQNVIHQKELENVEYLNYMRRIVRNDARYTPEIKCRIAMTKATFNKKTLFTSKRDFN
jgi:hypothetical protein